MAESQPDALIVRLHGRRIGVITRLAGDRNVFAFDQAYVEDENRPTLSLSFKGGSGGVINPARPYQGRLPPFFSNLLPEGHLREYLAARAGVKPGRDFFLLSALGKDLPGAISVSASMASSGDAAVVGHDGDDNIDGDRGGRGSRTPMRFSLAGVQLKFSAFMEAGGGLSIPADGMGGSWILKLPSARFAGVPENEFAMMELARRIGIDVPELKLVAMSEIEGLPRDAGAIDGRGLAVKRFDRTHEGGRVHMEDFAQVFGIYADAKYEKRSYANIAAVLSAEVGEAGVMEFVRRLVFSVLIGNADMHLKNWSLVYPDGRRTVLSPAYDFVSTVPYLPDDRLALGFGGSKDIATITPEQIRRFAETARLAVSPIWQLVLETTEKTLEAWKALEAKDVLSKAIREAVERHMGRVAAAIANSAKE